MKNLSPSLITDSILCYNSLKISQYISFYLIITLRSSYIHRSYIHRRVLSSENKVRPSSSELPLAVLRQFVT